MFLDTIHEEDVGKDRWQSALSIVIQDTLIVSLGSLFYVEKGRNNTAPSEMSCHWFCN